MGGMFALDELVWRALPLEWGHDTDSVFASPLQDASAG